MWVFTKDGFFSIVQHDTDADLLVVRARNGDDLVRGFGEVAVIEDEHADYRYRAFIGRSAVSEYLGDAVARIDYETGVKDVISNGDPSRKQALYRVWRAMWSWQEGHTQ